MTRDEFVRELEKTLELDSDSLSGTTPLENIGWDSFSEIAFLSLVDKQLGVQVPAERVSACRSVGQLLELVSPSLSG